ncbi:MAG: ferredoxin reductase family protein [Pseudomonadota bacterium]
MKAFVLVTAYLGVVLSPLGLSWAVGGPPRSLQNEIASGLGMLAFAMILVEFVLSGRFKSISNGIGMDVTMRFHQLMARTALGFAMIHPLLYTAAPAGGERPWDPTRQLVLTTDFTALASGIAAYLLLPCLVLLAIARTRLDYSYELWRALHGFGALIIAGLLLHHTIHAGRYGSLPAMTWVWAGMTVIAGGSLLYVYLVEPLLEAWRPWEVTEIVRLTPKQWRVTLTPTGHAGLTYDAGQFAWLNIGHSPFTFKENPFSISSAPADGPNVSFVVKELGDFSGSLGQLKSGIHAYLDGPYGNLTVADRSEPGVALIAGGVGIAPMLGILRQMELTDDVRQTRLVYGNRSETQIVERDWLASFDTTFVLSNPPENWDGAVGMIDNALLDRLFTRKDYENWLFVLCGPGPMLEGVEAHLLARGTPASQILSERFNYD